MILLLPLRPWLWCNGTLWILDLLLLWVHVQSPCRLNVLMALELGRQAACVGHHACLRAEGLCWGLPSAPSP